MNPGRGTLLLAAGVVVAVGAIIAGMLVAGSPAESRLRRLDDTRSSDLQRITYAVDGFWDRYERLPDSLGELTSDPRALTPVVDPENDRPYEYRRTGEQTFELCATFALPSRDEPRTTDGFQVHGAGRHCFPLAVSTS